MRQFILSTKVAIARVLCSPSIGWLISIATKRTPASSGIAVYVPPQPGSLITIASLFWGFYENAERRFVTKYMDPTLDVVELGSSIGFISCQIRRTINKERRLVLVEANPKLIGALMRNLELNQCSLNTEIISVAIAYNQPHVNFNMAQRNTGGHIEQNSDSSDTEAVSAMTLAAILESRKINDYVLVCDIEGAEAQILEYDFGALKSCRQIIIELHATRSNGRSISIDMLVARISQDFKLVERYGPVCVFERCQ